MIGQLHADKCDYHAICRQLSYLLVDNSLSYLLADNSISYLLADSYYFYCFMTHVHFFRLKSIVKRLLDLVFVLFRLKCIIKLLDSVFVICEIINVSVRVIKLAFNLADNSYLDSEILHITKTSSNNCLSLCYGQLVGVP